MSEQPSPESWSDTDRQMADLLDDSAAVSPFPVSPELQTRVERARVARALLARARSRPVLDSALRLLSLEMTLRSQAGVPVQLEEYFDRFPELAEQLRQRLERRANDGSPTTAIGDGPPPVPATATPNVPNYEILEELGRGGMGVVYKARQHGLNRLVALKMLGPLPRAEGRERFFAEAQAVARLQHPNVVQVYEVGEHAGRPYFSMEYVAGGSLAEQLDGTPLPPSHAAALIETLARAAHHAHTQGIVHRDLKPANILLQRKSEIRSTKSETNPNTKSPMSQTKAGGVSVIGSSDLGFVSDFEFRISDFDPKIADFGLAKHLAVEQARTQSGQVLGTPQYMAPEQATAKNADVGPAADVWALGILLYELLTGRPPFHAGTPLETMMQVCHHEPVSPRRLQPAVPRDLEVITLKCLEKEAGRRYPSAVALADDLADFREGKPIHARPVSRLEKTWRWCRLNRVATALLGVSIIALIALTSAITGAGYNNQLSSALAKTKQAQQDEAAARKVAEEARHTAEDAEQRTRALDYFHRILLASSELRDARLAEAKRLLNDCPVELRGWEWHYLYGQCQPRVRELRHDSDVYAVAASPDGALIASGCKDFTVRIWDARTGQLRSTLVGHSQRIMGLAFGPGGQLASASSDGTVRLWDAHQGKLVRSQVAHTGGVRSVVYRPDGKHLASAGKDALIKIWDSDSGAVLAELKGQPGQDHCLAYRGDGQLLAYGGRYGILLYELPSGKLLRTLTGHTAQVRALAFHPQGLQLASVAEDATLRLWPLTELTSATSLPEPRVLEGQLGQLLSVAWKPDGSLVATGGQDTAVRIWDPTTGEILHKLTFHNDRVYSLFWERTNDWLLSASPDRTVRIWESRGAGGNSLKTTSQVKALAWSPDGTHLVSGTAQQSILASWDVDRMQQCWAYQVKADGVSSLAFHPNGQTLVCGYYSGRLSLFNAEQGHLLDEQVGHAGPILVLAFDPGGGQLFSAAKDRSQKVWAQEANRLVPLDLSAPAWPIGTVPASQVLQAIPLPAQINRGVAWSPDGRLLATTDISAVVTIRDTATSKVVHELRGHTYGINAIAWSPDGRRLATASSDTTVRIWDPVTGQHALTLDGQGDGMISVVWSPDSRSLAAGTQVSGRILIWQAPPQP